MKGVIKMTRIEEIEARKAEIKVEVEAESADINALEEEVRSLNAEIETIKADAEKRQAIRDAVAAGEGEVITKIETEERKTMTNVEIRNSAEYKQAFMNALKTGDDKEARALLTTGAIGGQIPVPTELETEIKTAWESNQLMSLVKHSYFKGNFKVGFELSATGASVHVEGSEAPEEETVNIGSVEIKNETIKKWITVSDEALEGTTVDTMGYLYKEIAHKIVEKAEEILVGKITAAPAVANATAVGVPSVTANAVAADTIVNAVSKLSGQARNLHIVMNRQTYPAFVAVALNANYGIDVFDGLKDRIVFSDKLPAFGTASATEVYAVIGDFGYGAQANFPNGDEITMKVDDLSLAEKDLVKIVGKEYVGMALVADRAFVTIKK